MFIVGNWKTYLSSEDDAVAVAEGISPVEGARVVVCPSAVHLSAVLPSLVASRIGVGAQAVAVDSGANTGSESVEQLVEYGVQYVLVGHHERRQQGVTNADVARRVCHVLENGLTPIVCVSNVEEVRALIEGTRTACGDQLSACLFAYEPVEYIGASEPMSIEGISQAIAEIRGELEEEVAGSVQVLYGGSVNAENVASLRAPGVDGFLVGRASANADEFNALIRNATV